MFQATHNSQSRDMRTILVVEDDDTVAEIVRLTLEAEDFRVVELGDGASALDWMDNNTPDLIIADIGMPRMNGYQFYNRLRHNPDWRRIPFIFLSGKREAEDIRMAKELGADDYLTKPVDPADLVSAVWGRLNRFEELGVEVQRDDDGLPVGQYQISNIRVDLARRQVIVAEHVVELSSTEFDILQRLVLAGGAVVPHQELLGYAEEESLSQREAAELLRYHMRNLRQKIREVGEEDEPIVNVRRVGYRLFSRPTYLEDAH